MKNNKIFQILGLAIALFILALMLPNTKQTDASSTSVASLEEAITLNELKTSVVVVSEEKKEVTKPAVVAKKATKKIKVALQAKSAIGVMEVETKPIVREEILLTKMPVLSTTEVVNNFDSSKDLMKVQIENIELFKEIKSLEKELAEIEELRDSVASVPAVKETESNEVESKTLSGDVMQITDSVTVANAIAEFEKQIKEEEEVREKAQEKIQAVNKKTAEDKIEQIKAEKEELLLAENSIIEPVLEPAKKEVVKNTDTMTIGFNTQVIVESLSIPTDATAVNAVATPEIKIEKKEIVLEKLTLAKQDNLFFLAVEDSCAIDEMRFVKLTKADSLDENGRYALAHKEIFKKNGKKIEGKPYTECHELGKYYPDKPESERWVPIPWNLSRTNGNLGDTLKREENKLPLKEVLKE